MADIEILSGGDDTGADDDVLELGDAPTIDGAEATDELDSAEFPDTFDEDGEVEKPHLVAQLREANDKKTERIRALERQLSQPVIARTKKPDLWEDCEGDPEKFETDLLAWKDNERKADEQVASRNTEQNSAAQQWQTELGSYKQEASKLGPTFQESEDAVVAALTDAQQSTIVMAAKNPALFIKALGKSPNRLAQISLITNPIKLAAEVARIEGARTVPRKEPANIDTPLRGSARLSTPAGNEKEDALIKQAQKTGDSTELRNYRRAQKVAAKA